MILPASSWIDEVVEEFERPAQLSGAALPWSSNRRRADRRRGDQRGYSRPVVVVLDLVLSTI